MGSNRNCKSFEGENTTFTHESIPSTKEHGLGIVLGGLTCSYSFKVFHKTTKPYIFRFLWTRSLAVCGTLLLEKNSALIWIMRSILPFFK